jgi:ABC-type polar amino acid transport system ATPase subunit
MRAPGGQRAYTGRLGKDRSLTASMPASGGGAHPRWRSPDGSPPRCSDWRNPPFHCEREVAFPITLALTVAKGLPVAEAKALARQALRQVGLEDKIAAAPLQLSGGQQQRVAIARSLAMQPRLMLFDEITSALDPELVGEVVRVLEALAADGMTMILVTHEMGFARRAADTIVFVHQGRIWEKGPPAQLFAAPSTPELASFIDAMRYDLTPANPCNFR